MTVPDIRASDDERSRAVAALRDHAVAGRLTLDELGDRTAAVYAARTRSELERITDDLPPSPQPSRRSPTRTVLVVIGEAAKRGRWRVGRRLRVLVGVGECTLDLREAELESDDVNVTVVQAIGETTVIVPEHVDVELRGVILVGAKRERGLDPPRNPQAPLVRVSVAGLVGEVTVRRER